jgi:RND family efflux transporter MFP subunit
MRKIFLLAMACLAGEQALAESLNARGVIRAANEAVLRSSLDARIVKTPFRSGDVFKRGDVLLSYDCSRQRAEKNAAKAALRAADARLDSARELNALAAAGKFEVVLAQAEREEAAARLAAHSAQIKDCQLRAPYAGRVAELYVNSFETPENKAPLLKIVDVTELEIRLIVPSKWLSWLTPGTTLAFDVDETGQQQQATVTRIGAEVDAVSSTAAIVARIPKPGSAILPGMSGTAHFSQQDSNASQ